MRWRGIGRGVGWRGRVAYAAAAATALVGLVDRWVLDERWLAAVVVLVVLAPMLAVVAVAATARVAVITVGLQLVLLVGVIVASRVSVEPGSVGADGGLAAAVYGRCGLRAGGADGRPSPPHPDPMSSTFIPGLMLSLAARCRFLASCASSSEASGASK